MAAAVWQDDNHSYGHSTKSHKKAKLVSCVQNAEAILLGGEGKCPHCGEWNTLQEFREPSTDKATSHRFASLAGASPVQDLSEVQARELPRQPTGISEFDRALGAGSCLGRDPYWRRPRCG